MKVAWGLLSRPDELWAQVLLTKYLRNTDNGYVAARTKSFSAVWRGIQRAGPILNNGTQWAIRSGSQTKFWTDRWLDSGTILINHALNIQGVSINFVVKDFVLDNGLWNSTLIFSCLPSQIALQVLGMTPPAPNLGSDSMVWGLEPSGKFSIRTAYLLLKDLQEETSDHRWKGIWRWQGPNKIRHFLWLASHNRLLTNEERGRRHLTNQVLCSFCSTRTESCIHILRDCCFARQVWHKILPQVITGEELSKDWSTWLDTHIRNRDASHSITFWVGVWLLWRARNKRLFEQDIETYVEVAHRCDYWVALISSSWKTGQLGREVLSSTRQTQLIGVAAAGGVIRTDSGCFVKAFSANLGSCSITRAEMRAIVDGLQLAWTLGIRRIRVQSDSIAAIAILAKDFELEHQHAALVLQFKELCSRHWEVHLSHSYREANYAADYLANLGHSFLYGMHIFDSPDRDLSHWLHYDLIGVSVPRLVRFTHNI
ncbi:Putative ribonuclease H protein At1g65750 [Linum grandiflorum]